jgi:hypothetical protein
MCELQEERRRASGQEDALATDPPHLAARPEKPRIAPAAWAEGRQIEADRP